MSTFPSIVTGVVTQLPWGVMQTASVSRVSMDHGFVYAYYYVATPLLSWELNFSVLTASELSTLWTFWEAMKGAWDTFSFTDPDTSTAYTCRFEGDDFAVSYLGAGQYSLKLVITEVR